MPRTSARTTPTTGAKRRTTTAIGAETREAAVQVRLESLQRAATERREDAVDVARRRVAAAFDVDPTLVGQRLEEIPVYHLDQLAEVVQQLQIRLAIIAVPAPDQIA